MALNRILVIDVGGTHIKLQATIHKEPVIIPSGPKMTAKKMVAAVKKYTADWGIDVISMGFPGPVVHNHIISEPYNLGRGWVGFNFAKAFGCPVKIINDAAMQALADYRGRRMLFLGLGTGLGSAMIIDGVMEPMELAHLPYKNGKTYEDYVGLSGLRRLGKKKWRQEVRDIVKKFKAALQVDYIVVGGGNSRLLKKLPDGAQLGRNLDVFQGGYRLWKKNLINKKGHWPDLINRNT